jgi:hypothetical protein
VAEIGDITRFSSARKLASWAELTPTVRGSDRTVRYGHISKQGDPWLRWIMNQAAQTAKRTPPYAACFEQIAHRRGRKIATIAVARKLLPTSTTCCASSTRLNSRRSRPPRPDDHTPRTGHQAPGELALPHEPATARLLT